MPKGGARVPSDSFAVSKAMGLEYYFETLNILYNNPTNFFQINEFALMLILNYITASAVIIITLFSIKDNQIIENNFIAFILRLMI
jgi:hypothetical protein